MVAVESAPVRWNLCDLSPNQSNRECGECSPLPISVGEAEHWDVTPEADGRETLDNIVLLYGRVLYRDAFGESGDEVRLLRSAWPPATHIWIPQLQQEHLEILIHFPYNYLAPGDFPASKRRGLLTIPARATVLRSQGSGKTAARSTAVAALGRTFTLVAARSSNSKYE
jgi:hypothetical protein